MNSPQIIWIVLMATNLVAAGYYHNKPKIGKHNGISTIVSLLLLNVLLYWGGFFG